MNMEVDLKAVRMLIMDVGGTMTDGKIYIGENGEIFKTFNTKDGYGIDLLKQNGIIPVIITGRESKIVSKRAEELGITEVYQGVKSKIDVYENLKERYNFCDKEVAYIGDDLDDIDIMKRAGISFGTGDCVLEVAKICSHVCSCRGGEGAVREAIDIIIENQIDKL